MIKRLGLTVGLCLVFFVLLEGISSTAYALFKILSPAAPGRALSGPHLHYDRELGWVSVPNFRDNSYYAPGIDLVTNSRGFRAAEEFTVPVPPGRFRIVCSGDSQTFGDGAGNEHTWCHDLESLNPRIQTVNMAEIGYGADQMYLRYKRDGLAIDQDVHLFAFVTDDLLRMRRTTMGGYGKPVLKISNNELIAGNVAMGETSAFLHWLALKPHPLRQFRSVAVVADTADWWRAKRPVAVEQPGDEERRVIGKMIQSLQAMSRSKNSTLVLVYIPTRTVDYTAGGTSEPWRELIRTECARTGAQLIDLIDDYRKLPITTRDGLFIWQGAVQNFAESIGHFSDQGHEYIARQVYAKLTAMPELARKLNERAEVSRQ
ncbi:MAG: hypothetical protein M3N54_06875 [Acidobacteriota bacterium]|nr:hypothetical protein [Acidobacteriota bacterium]